MQASCSRLGACMCGRAGTGTSTSYRWGESRTSRASSTYACPGLVGSRREGASAIAWCGPPPASNPLLFPLLLSYLYLFGAAARRARRRRPRAAVTSHRLRRGRDGSRRPSRGACRKMHKQGSAVVKVLTTKRGAAFGGWLSSASCARERQEERDGALGRLHDAL
jgi:hypothetical protein